MEYFVSLKRALELAKKVQLELTHTATPLDEAHGRILAEDVASLVDDPPFDNSSMDGFAVIHTDTIEPPTRLRIVGTSQAAAISNPVRVGKGEAARVMTGAPMPPGTDAIIMVEKTTVSDDSEWVELQTSAKSDWVRKRGENLTKGQIALTAGEKLTPHHIGLAATMGHSSISVFSSPKISIIPTGDELKQPGEELETGEIYESNSFGIAGLVENAGCIPLRKNACVDSLDELRKALDEAAKESDVIITSGGVSMGEWDLVRRIMEEEGNIHFWRVKIRPGSPPLFGLWKGTPIFGLPGNPVSSHIVFRMLVKPWIMSQFGVEGQLETVVPAKLIDDLKATKDCHTLRRIFVYSQEGELVASVKTHQGSGNLHSMVAANALTFLPPGSTAKCGETISVILL